MKLDPIPTNSRLSHLAVEIAEKFRPHMENGHFTQTDLAMAIQQGIDRSAAPELRAIVRQIAECDDYGGLHMDEIGCAARAAIAKATL